MTTTSPTPDPDRKPFLELMVNIAVPTIVLTVLSKEKYLGPVLGLIIAVALPLGYGVYDGIRRKQVNFYSLVGLISVLLTGVFGLFKMDPLWFASKEAVMPLIFAAAILLSHAHHTPFIRSLFLQPELVNQKLLERCLADNPPRQFAFSRLLFQASLMLSGTMVLSSFANFFLAMHFVGGTEPGSEEYTAGIGKATGMGFLVIGLPMVIAMLGVFWFVMRGLVRVTGQELADLTNPGETVRREVRRSSSAGGTGHDQAE